MKEHIAKLVSYIFHPVFLALITPFLFEFKHTASFSEGVEWLIFSSFFIFLTGITFYILRPKKILFDFDISIKQDRHLFYTIALLTAIIYFIISVIFKGIFFHLSIVALGIIIGIILIDLANYYLKVSMHMAVLTAYTITVFILFGLVPSLYFVWVLPVMAWARFILKKHTIKELVAGTFLGASITCITFIIGRVIL